MTLHPYLGRGLEDTLRDLGLATDADGMVRPDLLDELVLGECFCKMIYMKALSLQGLNCLLADVFEQQEFEVLIVYGMEDSWLAYNVITNGDGIFAKSIMQVGRGG